MEKAFKKWQTATKKEITFEIVNNSNVADITVEFVETLPGLAVGLCMNDYDEKYITKSVILLAKKNKFKSILTNDEYYRIMLHEIGHALGLKHSTHLNSIMRPNTIEITDISLDDKKDFRELYGQD